ncbi:hypothetical protein [Nocardia brasiliensis]|uniref:hypothetical protein n=1 Tax=Nocardia brasiliensis TaxID=37326 RepID=UPI0024560BDD|nr:hypothetical protein [Nocardia brasiliensis]
MSGDLFLTRPEMSELMKQLRALPGVLDDLAVTVARQGVRGKAGVGSRGVPASRPPIDLDAFAARQALHWELYTAVRAVLEQRHLPYESAATAEPTPRAWLSLVWVPGEFVGPLQPGVTLPAIPEPPTTLELARWLDRHLIPFAMTEHAHRMYVDILAAVRACRDVVDLPAEDVVLVTEARLRAANNSVLTADQVERIAAGLGDIGRGLNRDRVRYLAKRGLAVAARDGDTKFYRLGDVLAAHQRHGRRPKQALGGDAA